MQSFELLGATLELPDIILTPDLTNKLSQGVYEVQEASAIQHFVEPRDVVMEIGAGVGFVSVIAGQIVGGHNVIAIEANPELIPIIKHNHALNSISNATILNYAVAADAASSHVKLYLNRAFWASTTLAGKGAEKSVEVPAISLEEVTQKWQPTVLVCDVEGGEKDFFKAPLPQCVRLIILEFHPKKYAAGEFDIILARLAAIGFAYAFFDTPDDVACFARA